MLLRIFLYTEVQSFTQTNNNNNKNELFKHIPEVGF